MITVPDAARPTPSKQSSGSRILLVFVLLSFVVPAMVAVLARFLWE